MSRSLFAIWKWMLGCGIVLLLSGCMYQNEARMENAPPPQEEIAQVQDVIDQFYEDEGVLPIRTPESDTPVYHRYVIDFHRLIPQYMNEPPDHSFDLGGIYQYVLVNVEEAPEVKLIDLRLSQEVSRVQSQVNEYLREGEFLPVDETISGGYFTLDYDQLGMAEPELISPFSQQRLPIVVDQRGEAGIDYRRDLYQRLEDVDLEEYDFEEGDDIRDLLVEDSLFVPSHSFPYTLADGEVVFIESWNEQN